MGLKTAMVLRIHKSRMQRLHHGIFWRPTSIQSTINGLGLHADYSGPRSYTFGASVYSQHCVIPFIVLLLLLGSPPNIANFVMSTYINAVEGVLWRWSASNRIYDVLNRCQTAFDAPPPVIFIVLVVGVITTLSGEGAGCVFYCCSTSAFAVRGLLLCRILTPEASARCCVTVLQICCGSFGNCTALTFAPPKLVVSPFPCVTKNCKASKGTACQILKFIPILVNWMRLKNNVIFGVRHGVYSYLVNSLTRAVESWRFLQPVHIIA